jgi:hypothetical protein
LLLAVVADRLARRIDAAGRVESDTIRPPQTEAMRSSADDAVAVLHQVDQQVEHLRLHRDGLGAAALAPVGISV